MTSESSANNQKVLEVDYNKMCVKTKDLLFWTNPIHSGIVFAILLVVEIVLMSMSFLSIVGYTGLALLFALLGFRAFLKFSGKPDSYGILEKLDRKIELTSEEAEKMTKSCVTKLESSLESLRELLLLKNVTNSLKFGFALYVLTYIGARFNFLTLCLITTVCLFTFPKIYELKKNEIDKLWDLIKEKVKELNTLAINKLSQLHIPGISGGAKQKDH